MILKVKNSLFTLCFSIALPLLNSKVYGQSDIEKVNQKVEEVSKKVNNVIDDIFSTKKKSQAKTKTPNKTSDTKNLNLTELNLTGKWKGVSGRDVVYTYDFNLNLSQTGNSLNGFAEFKTDRVFCKYKVSGKVNGKEFFLSQDEIIEQLGANSIEKYDFKGTISSKDGNLKISGKAINTNHLYFTNKKIVKDPTEYDPRFESINYKEFSISKVNEIEELEQNRKQCISGNCDNGTGVKVTELGKYEGEFQNGRMHGKGVFTYYSGIYKGDRYIGEFQNDFFNGYGTLYDVVAKETSKNSLYSKNTTGIGTSNNEVLYPMFEGSWIQNYPNGLGKMYNGGLPQVGIWLGWYLYNHKALDFPVLKYHLDTTFSNFQKCNCLTPAKIKINATGLGSVLYDVYDAESGRYIRTKSEIETVDKSFVTNGYINKTNKVIYIKGYRKVHNVETNQDEYIDESFAVWPNGETQLNFRSLPEAGDFIEVRSKENFIYLGQYCRKGDANCKPVSK